MLAVGYLTEPVMSQVYMRNIIAAGEKALLSLRKIIFRLLLQQEIDFYDRHRTSELTNALAVELDTLRSFLFSNVTRDRGFRALLEATGVVIILCTLSWRLGPILAGEKWNECIGSTRSIDPSTQDICCLLKQSYSWLP